jgi:dolichol-phosphate mannosyltransferase
LTSLISAASLRIPHATVIVPTRNEAGNARLLLHRMDAAMRGYDVEVLFVDDGTDDLPAVIAECAREISLPVRVLRRDQPVGRLGGAVVAGIRDTSSEVVVVCDGDLQHPPETIPQLLDAAASSDLVVASRYVGGGDAGGLANRGRVIVSRASGLLSRALFPRRMRNCSDPMSGFFAVRRSALDVEKLRPRGFKILLEIVARSRPLSIREVPFSFGARHEGESHASAAEGLRFLRQLAELRLASSGITRRALLYAIVGLSGVIPNLLALSLLTAAGVQYVLAAILAIQVAIVWNFAGAELLVWRNDRAAGGLGRRFAGFAAVGQTDLARIPFVVVLVEAVGVSSIAATLITVALAFAARFVLVDRLVYRRQAAPAGLAGPAALARAEPAPSLV